MKSKGLVEKLKCHSILKLKLTVIFFFVCYSIVHANSVFAWGYYSEIRNCDGCNALVPGNNGKFIVTQSGKTWIYGPTDSNGRALISVDNLPGYVIHEMYHDGPAGQEYWGYTSVFIDENNRGNRIFKRNMPYVADVSFKTSSGTFIQQPVFSNTTNTDARVSVIVPNDYPYGAENTLYAKIEIKNSSGSVVYSKEKSRLGSGDILFSDIPLVSNGEYQRRVYLRTTYGDWTSAIKRLTDSWAYERGPVVDVPGEVKIRRVCLSGYDCSIPPAIQPGEYRIQASLDNVSLANVVGEIEYYHTCHDGASDVCDRESFSIPVNATRDFTSSYCSFTSNITNYRDCQISAKIFYQGIGSPHGPISNNVRVSYVEQPVECSYSLTPVSGDFSSDGGASNITVSGSPPNCTAGSWSVTKDSDWISLTGVSSGQGGGTWLVPYLVAFNDEEPRSGYLQVAGKNHYVSQDGSQSYQINVGDNAYIITDSNGPSLENHFDFDGLLKIKALVNVGTSRDELIAELGDVFETGGGATHFDIDNYFIYDNSDVSIYTPYFAESTLKELLDNDSERYKSYMYIIPQIIGSHDHLRIKPDYNRIDNFRHEINELLSRLGYKGTVEEKFLGYMNDASAGHVTVSASEISLASNIASTSILLGQISSPALEGLKSVGALGVISGGAAVLADMYNGYNKIKGFYDNINAWSYLYENFLMSYDVSAMLDIFELIQNSVDDPQYSKAVTDLRGMLDFERSPESLKSLFVLTNEHLIRHQYMDIGFIGASLNANVVAFTASTYYAVTGVAAAGTLGLAAGSLGAVIYALDGLEDSNYYNEKIKTHEVRQALLFNLYQSIKLHRRQKYLDIQDKGGIAEDYGKLKLLNSVFYGIVTSDLIDGLEAIELDGNYFFNFLAKLLPEYENAETFQVFAREKLNEYAGEMFVAKEQKYFYEAIDLVLEFDQINRSQTIAFSTAPSSLLVGQSGALLATSTSGLNVDFSSKTIAVCAVNDGAIVGLAPGTCTVSANQEGDDIYGPALEVVRNVPIVVPSRINQTINFSTYPTSIQVGRAGVLTADASSGLPVVFSTYTNSVCSVSNDGVIALASGVCSVAANQEGNGSYNPAPEVIVNLAVIAPEKNNQTITFNTVPLNLKAGEVGMLDASASSGGVINYISKTGSICSVRGATVTALSAGTCRVAANQEGDEVYNPASEVVIDVPIEKADQSIDFAAYPSTLQVGQTVALSASATSGLPVIFGSGAETICSVNGSTVTARSTGICTVTANQAGDGRYKTATEVIRSISIVEDEHDRLAEGAHVIIPIIISLLEESQRESPQRETLVSYNFENDSLSAPPSGFQFNSNWGDGGTIRVESNIGGNTTKTLRVVGRPGGAQGIYAPGTVQSSGTVEIKLRVYVQDGDTVYRNSSYTCYAGKCMSLLTKYGDGSTFDIYVDGAERAIVGLSFGQWYELTATFDLDQETIEVEVNGQTISVPQFTPDLSGGWASDFSFYGNNNGDVASYYDDIILTRF